MSTSLVTPMVRCAIYTRTAAITAGDSLDEQRGAGEEFVSSQADAGWVLVPERYDDEGYPGNNTNGPALQRLLEDVKSGKVQKVVVSKCDRLSRSYEVFAELVGILKEHGVGLVSTEVPFIDVTAPDGLKSYIFWNALKREVLRKRREVIRKRFEQAGERK